MPTVQFSNGHTVQFSTMPTQQQIESFAQQQGWVQAKQQSPFNPNTPNSQFTQPTQSTTKMDYSNAPGTNVSSHIFSGTKDALNTMFVKPEQRLIAEAGTRIAQVGVQTANEFKNTGYDTPIDTGNPQRQSRSGTKPLPLNAPKPIANTSNSEMNINNPQHQFGVTVQPQQQGMAGVKQIGEQALNAVDAIGNVALAEAVLPIAINKATPMVKSGLNIAKNIADKTVGKQALARDLANIEAKATAKASGTNRGFMGIKGKALSDVLATPEKDVAKLNPTERSAWFENKQTEINTKSSQVSQQIKTNLQKSADVAAKNDEVLQRQLQTTARDKVIELRPKIVKSMGQQSKIYRGLIDEEMAGKENIPVSVNDLKTHIDTKYGDNPGLAQAIKDRLGLTEEVAKTLKKGELPTIQTKEPTKTLGELYNQTKSLKQDISSGAKAGSKTFTPEDKLTDDAISTLTEFMKKNGVDFSEANKFWAKYAPVRNQLVSEAKPFLQTGTQTKTFAQTLVRVAKGTDVNNENFINEVENLVKKPITKESKAIIQKLNANEKSALAQEVQAETAKMENKLATEQATKQLSNKQYEVERQARTRSIIKKILYTAGGLGIDKIVKKYTGIGF